MTLNAAFWWHVLHKKEPPIKNGVALFLGVANWANHEILIRKMSDMTYKIEACNNRFA